MVDDEYREWLNRFNVSRPHRTGRWRVWWNDTVTVAMPPYVLAVANFESMAPSHTDLEYFHRWRDSDERRHKQNASGFLRFAIRRRRLVDGSGETQVKRVREMAGKIKQAMFLFSDGDFDKGSELMNAAWGDYMMLVVLSRHELAAKGARFPSGRPRGAKGTFTLLVEEAARAANSKNWKVVIKWLEDSNRIVDEVDWDGEKIWIFGENKHRSFQRVRNILSEL